MTKKLTLSEFVEKSNKKHNYKYNYTKSIYINKRSKIEIICNIHGPFWQDAGQHMYKNGCPECGNFMTGYKQLYSTEIFIEKASIKHNNKYNYSKTIYLGASYDLEIICHKHGAFWQRASHHLEGHGCFKCKPQNYIMTAEEFAKKANKIHNNKYNYSKVVFKGAPNKIEIICLKHGAFWQNAGNHLHLKTNCPVCAAIGISKKENEWLDYCGITKENRQVTIKVNNKKFVVDGIDFKNKTIYEFYGDFWHGNPNKYSPNEVNNINKFTFGELYHKTIERENILKSGGYKIISIWEEDFKYRKINAV